ncbi:hypothetical protein [Paraglaciecola sp. 25GB23A]|uniref:hypothetical protein n=1 Tax=Paraglaciecola sp. 25GB23A TaxID=3156068 RepID=UPI0032AF533C
MEENELATLTDEELLQRAKDIESSPIANAILIGFLIGIIIYSILVNSVGLFTLIPLYFVYKLVEKSKRNTAIEKIMKERNKK